ncbi:penicillin-binding transpeptidase domain-containing protein [Bacillus carboniphilus]|uniref:Penicillin-binding transpeptidase domain-containing protein n=1 Tax=Bacillus carboniphilus TaxID=86663 RepID=A0ABY9JVM4_9BACI|nr:penicillin-binding transpeptidase domain-containing protein [Bacillus carboniphilus]WLR42538.1 penicillin-binding transpeptidase domain-containing protein [Bacillus carboniphilus]
MNILEQPGLEQVYEEVLHGETGWKILVGEQAIASKPKVDGEDIYLTLDANLQGNLYDQLKATSGASVAIDPTTGETLAMVSSPAYNPNDYILGFDEGEYDTLKNNPNDPFSAKFNNKYSPGSTLKPLTAAIGLESETLDPEKVEEITGEKWEKYNVTRWSDKDSQVDLADALIQSDNIYFARQAVNMGAETFEKGLESFKFNQELDFPFPIATSSIANDSLTETLLAHSAYGQGQVLMSPFHLVMTYTMFVNEGNMISPYLRKEDGPAKKEQLIKAENAELINSHLRQVVASSNGTAKDAAVEGLAIAGKTGTAELKKTGEEKGQENGWFVAYEEEKKNLLIAMMMEDVKDGSHDTLKPVAEVFRNYQK